MPRGREYDLRPTRSQLTLEDDRWRGPTPKAATGVIGLDEDMVDTRAAAAVAATVAVSSGLLRLLVLARPCVLCCPIRRFLAVLGGRAEADDEAALAVVAVGGDIRCLCPRRRRRSWSWSTGHESEDTPPHEVMLVFGTKSTRLLLCSNAFQLKRRNSSLFALVELRRSRPKKWKRGRPPSTATLTQQWRVHSSGTTNFVRHR